MTSLTSSNDQPSYQKLSDRVVTVSGGNPGPFTLQGTNTYLVGTGSKRFLIDTGQPNSPQYMKNLKAAMSEYGIKGFEAILVTHWHHDHTGSVVPVLEEFGQQQTIPVYRMNIRPDARPGDFVVHSSWTLAPDSDLPPRDDTATNSSESKADKKLQQQQKSSSSSVQVHLHGAVNGQKFSVEGATLTAIHTPGHANDHLCFWFEEEQTIFTGDCILGHGTTAIRDLSDFMQSLHKLKTFKPKSLYPGHGPFIAQGVTKIDEYIAHRMLRETQLMKALQESKEPLTSLQLMKAVYDSKVISVPSVALAANNNVKLHLHKLEMDKKIVHQLPSGQSQSQDKESIGSTVTTVVAPQKFSADEVRDDWTWTTIGGPKL